MFVVGQGLRAAVGHALAGQGRAGVSTEFGTGAQNEEEREEREGSTGRRGSDTRGGLERLEGETEAILIGSARDKSGFILFEILMGPSQSHVVWSETTSFSPPHSLSTMMEPGKVLVSISFTTAKPCSPWPWPCGGIRWHFTHLIRLHATLECRPRGGTHHLVGWGTYLPANETMFV